MRTIIDLTDDQIDGLKQLAERDELSRAELVRRAVDGYLERKRTSDGDEAFGLWAKADQPARDGSRYQTALRLQWSNVQRKS